MMIAPTDNEVVCVDYREKAPGSVDKFTFTQQESRHDAKMVGVPGTVRGLWLAHQEYGKRSWRELVRPAAELARNGVPVDVHLAGSLNYVVANCRRANDALYAETLRIYAHEDGRDWQAGDTLKLPELAQTLDRIAIDPNDFYGGETAQRLIDFMSKNDGLMTMDDLANYDSKIRKATRTEFRGMEVFGPPPPSSGGITIGLALNILDELEFNKSDSSMDWTVEQMHLVAETMRWAFRERAEHLGDADFVEIPEHLLTREHAKAIAAKISRQKASTSQAIAGNIPLSEGAYESPQTTHFSVVDAEGMAVSNTYTLESAWGARVIAPGTGFVLNNEMGDFNWYPGYTNLRGAIGTEPNQLAPGKRMLSSMSPTIVKKDGKTILAVGSPGGRTIINTTLGIILQRLVLERSLEEAVAATRFHHGWLPDQLRMESANVNGRDPEKLSVMDALLKALGHEVRRVGQQSSVHTIEVDLETGKRKGVSDFRRGGKVSVE